MRRYRVIPVFVIERLSGHKRPERRSYASAEWEYRVADAPYVTGLRMALLMVSGDDSAKNCQGSEAVLPLA